MAIYVVAPFYRVLSAVLKRGTGKISGYNAQPRLGMTRRRIGFQPPRQCAGEKGQLLAARAQRRTYVSVDAFTCSWSDFAREAQENRRF